MHLHHKELLMHMCIPFLSGVSHSLSLYTNNINGHNFLVPSNVYPCMLPYCHGAGLPVWDIILVNVRYPHHICHTTLLTQDALSSAQWSLLLANQLNGFPILFTLWISCCHRLVDSMIRNCIALLLKCLLWVWGIIDNWHVITVNIWGTRCWNTHHHQLLSDGTQYVHSNLHSYKLCAKYWCFTFRLFLWIPINEWHVIYIINLVLDLWVCLSLTWLLSFKKIDPPLCL